jgi:hypothetical protein
MERALAATRKRHAHILANEQGTSIQNGGQNAIQNEAAEAKLLLPNLLSFFT